MTERERIVFLEGMEEGSYGIVEILEAIPGVDQRLIAQLKFTIMISLGRVAEKVTAHTVHSPEACKKIHETVDTIRQEAADDMRPFILQSKQEFEQQSATEIAEKAIGETKERGN